MTGWLLGAAAAAAAAPAARDSVPAYTMPPFEIRATRLSDPAGPYPLAARRIDRETIARRPGGGLHEVLAPAAGVRVASWGAPDAGSAVSIRGSTPDQVLVLVDGRRINTAQGGGVDLATIPLEWVESVEVFRGGGSALWGGSAVGGAIDVRTRAPHPGERRIRVALASQQGRTVTGGAAVPLGSGWAGRASGRFFATDGSWEWTDDRRGTTSSMENADVARAEGSVRVDGRAGGADLAVDVAATGSERGVPGSEEFPTPTARLEDRWGAAGVHAGRGAGRWRATADAGWSRLNREYREPGGAFGPVHDAHENSRLETEIAATRTGGRTALRIAAGASRDRLDSSTDGERSRDALDVRGQLSRDLEWHGRPIRWMAAVRADAVRGFRPFVSPRLGVQAGVRDRLSVRLSFGLSYRAPSFDELFWPARATAAGNPGLRAERGGDLDAGIALRDLQAGGELSLDAFVRRVDDLIQWTPGASGIWRPHNVGRATIGGVEAQGRFAPRLPFSFRGEVVGSAALLGSRDGTGEPNVDGKELPYRPRWSGAAGVLATRGPCELETLWRWVDAVWVTRANTKTLPGYVVGDVRARIALGRAFAIDAAVRNVARTSARDFRDYPLPGRTFELGASAQAGR
jgi:outer membrane cobalamin receptor